MLFHSFLSSFPPRPILKTPLGSSQSQSSRILWIRRLRSLQSSRFWCSSFFIGALKNLLQPATFAFSTLSVCFSTFVRFTFKGDRNHAVLRVTATTLSVFMIKWSCTQGDFSQIGPSTFMTFVESEEEVTCRIRMYSHLLGM
jgi:hypothetical protein